MQSLGIRREGGGEEGEGEGGGDGTSSTQEMQTKGGGGCRHHVESRRSFMGELSVAGVTI